MLTLQQLYDKDYNNNLLIFGPASAGIAANVLETTCKMTYNKTLYDEREGPNGIQPMFWHWLYNDGLMKYCALKSHCGLSRLSVVFTDGFCWLGEGQSGMMPCDKDVYKKGVELPKTLRTLWTWHGRIGHEKDDCVDIKKNYLVSAIRRRIYEVLETGLDMRGRDLFPGPAVVS